MIAIINYDMGNLGSLVNILKRIGVKSIVTNLPEEIDRADKIILPGVGAFDTAIKKLNNIKGMRNILEKKAKIQKVPILGICLGMQLMTLKSEEGNLDGLGWIKGKTYKFPKSKNHKIPHMGWNTVRKLLDDKISIDMTNGFKFYFVHSYYVKVFNNKNSFLKTNYNVEFDSGIFDKNIYGVQFHPEKSHSFGMHLLKNFSKL